MKKTINTEKFGPWAIVTGASSGIGHEFARQLAAQGFNLVLVARRLSLLEETGRQLAAQYGIQYRTIEANLTEEAAIEKIITATGDIDIGLLISNAGTGSVQRFLSAGVEDLKYIVQLNAISHMQLAHHFGKKMTGRGGGGILFTGAMGAADGVPYMANEAGTKGYIQSLGKSLHEELGLHGIHVTVLVATPTDTPIFYKLGFTKKNSPIPPITVRQCVSEALTALNQNKITVMPGLRFRLLNALVPRSLSRKMTGKMMKQNNNL